MTQQQHRHSEVQIYPDWSWIRVDLWTYVDPDTLDRLSRTLKAPRPVWPPQVLRWALYKELSR